MSAPANPPAFPVADVRDELGNGLVEGSAGMTLRDWFAGQALSSTINHVMAVTTMGNPASRIAVLAYQLADEMLAARGAA